MEEKDYLVDSFFYESIQLFIDVVIASSQVFQSPCRNGVSESFFPQVV